ncbi:MAG: hypothetical protein P4M01_05400 [Acidobacteriota bacterium]|nr:hypothetical protein [Acidobacteriota bacterium]
MKIHKTKGFYMFFRNRDRIADCAAIKILDSRYQIYIGINAESRAFGGVAHGHSHHPAG